MMISKINSINFKAKLTPLSEYKGPILKLTAEEVKRIKILTDKKDFFEKQLNLIKKNLMQNKNITGANKINLINSKEFFEFQLLKINNIILGIKKERLRIQKLEQEQKS
ncbi:hypothetical protein IKB17_03740 [bacterium]|nr:hypothetical protein [bacterium]